jgi:hypothetical protein
MQLRYELAILSRLPPRQRMLVIRKLIEARKRREKLEKFHRGLKLP